MLGKPGIGQRAAARRVSLRDGVAKRIQPKALHFLRPETCRYDSRYETIHSFSRCLRSSFASKRIPTLLLGFFQDT